MSFTFQYSIFNMQIHSHNASQYCTYLEINFQKQEKESLQFCMVQATLFRLSFLYTTPLATFSFSLRICIDAYKRGCIKSSCCGALLRAQKLPFFFFLNSLMLSQHKTRFTGFISIMTLAVVWIFPNCSQLPAEISCHSVLQQQATQAVISFCHDLGRVSHDSVAELLPR